MAEDLSIDNAANNITFRDYNRKVDMDADPNESGYLDFDGYLKLMVAQMSNQDFNDPMSDSEFISQMANYSMMETISKMNKQSEISYAASLVGKAVTVDDGTTVDTGVVESVIIEDGKYQLLINGDKYETNTVTDIVDSRTYNTLTGVIGMTGTVNDGKTTVTGKITNILITKGQGFVIINEKPYPFESVDITDKAPDTSDKTEGTEGTENAEGTDGTESADTENTAESTENNTNPPADETGEGTSSTENLNSERQSANVDASTASMGLTDDSSEVFQNVEEKLSQFYDENGQYIGKTNYEGINGYSGETDHSSDLGVYGGSREDTDNGTDSAISGTAAAEAARSASVQLENGYYSTKVEDVSSSFSGINNHSDEDGVTTRANSEPMQVSYAEELSASANSKTISDYGKAPDISTGTDISDISSAYGGNINTTGGYTSSLNSSRNPLQFVEDPGVPYGLTVGSNKAYDKWPPAMRAFQNSYPYEAELANSYNTKMYDIRFIHNTDITSVINTDKILGYTITGKAFTDIGFSGKGKLGEIVTWADGTQRVEIISRSGSTWYTTSGRYTIDQICDTSGNFIADDLTPFEQVIRAAGREYTPEEQGYLDNFAVYGAQVSRNALLESEKKAGEKTESKTSDNSSSAGTPNVTTNYEAAALNSANSITTLLDGNDTKDDKEEK